MDLEGHPKKPLLRRRHWDIAVLLYPCCGQMGRVLWLAEARKEFARLPPSERVAMMNAVLKLEAFGPRLAYLAFERRTWFSRIA
jgi:hypothetical protein